MDYTEGQVLLFDKPFGWTSFQLVNKIRWIIRNKKNIKKIKVGHGGTLDPLATGLMIVCTGKATKKLNDFQNYDKEYIAKIELGKTTPSFDLETPFDGEFPTEHINKNLIEKVLQNFKGKQEQIPPIFSAKWVNGKRAYEMAREKKEIELKPAEICINDIELLDYNMPFISVRLNCSKGTYVRSFARDLGVKLNSGAYLAGLKRTAIGPFLLNNAIDIEQFEED